MDQEKLLSLTSFYEQLASSPSMTHSYAKISSFRGKRRKKVAYTSFGTEQGPLGALVISAGRTEASVKYLELATDMIKLGYSPVYVIDHRGQGLSQRLVYDEHKGHVDRFNYFSEDFNTFIETVVKKKTKNQKLYLIAHSMGAAIVADYLIKYQHPFEKVVLSAPMLMLPLDDSEEHTLELTKPACQGLGFLIGKCRSYIPGGSGFTQSDFEQNQVTSSPNRYKLNRLVYKLWDQSKLGSPTIGWVRQSLMATIDVRKHAHEIKVPMLLLQASNDTIVDNRGQNIFCDNSKSCHLEVIQGGKHELLMERAEIRELALDFIKKFFTE
jgi:lysophospholipase